LKGKTTLTFLGTSLWLQLQELPDLVDQNLLIIICCFFPLPFVALPVDHWLTKLVLGGGGQPTPRAMQTDADSRAVKPAPPVALPVAVKEW